MKLIAFDIDGTSINHYHRVSDKTKTILKELHELGIILVPTTGRCLSDIPKAFLKLGVCDYAITSNGARVTNLKTGETLYEKTLSTASINTLLANVSIDDWMVSVHHDNQVYDSRNLVRLGRRILFHHDFKISPRIKNFEAWLRVEKDVEKIQLTSSSRSFLQATLNTLQSLPNFEIPLTHGNYMEITEKGVHKLSGVQALCDHLGLSLREVFAIGDEANDFKLLQGAGYSVAMGNAPQTIKAVAKATTLSNREDGFYQALYDYFIAQ